MKYKAIFSDFDGTLLSNDLKVSKENIDAINRYKACGGNFYISTGRLFQSINKFLPQLGLDRGEIIVSQGASIYDIKSKKAIKDYVIDKKTSNMICDFIDSEIAQGYTLIPIMYLNDAPYFYEEHIYVDKFCEIVNVDPIIIHTTYKKYLKNINKLPTKFLAMIEEDKMEEFINKGKKLFNGKIAFCRSRGFLVEMLPVTTNKGNAVKYVCQKNGFKLDEVICIGDSENDISMLDISFGVAVEDSLGDVKNHAKYISKSCDNSAIADVINNLCLKEGL